MPKLTDVAALAGLSPATVSRYLNGRLDLPQATRDRIESAIVTLGYRPNLLARRLSTGRSEAISLVVPDIANPFFAEIAGGVGAQARAYGLALYLTITDGDPLREAEALRALADNAVEGMILATRRPDDGRLAQLLSRHRQVVLLDEDIPGAPVPGIFAENAQGARMATQALIAAGHRDIAMIAGPPGVMSMRERQDGFLQAMDAAGLPVPPGRIVAGDYSRAHGRAAGLSLLRGPAPPTAIFATADVIAIGVIESVRACGLSVPRDLSVTGFDDMEFADLIDPPLTTIRQPAAQMGLLAVDRLRDLMAGRPTPPVTRLPVTLIARRSVAAPRPDHSRERGPLP
jgi:LacI family transcriptional regulator